MRLGLAGLVGREVGEGDVELAFRRVNAMPWNEARNMVDGAGNPLVEHPPTLGGERDSSPPPMPAGWTGTPS